MATNSTVDQTNARGGFERNANSPLFKAANKVLGFLLQRNIGPMKGVLMLVTTTGRRTGKQHTTPIGYVPDGDTILSFTMGGGSNWYKNVLKQSRAILTVKGKRLAATARPVEGDENILAVLRVYQQRRPQDMQRFFGIDPNGTPDQLLAAKQRVKFVRWVPERSTRS
jgi:deazaflavin-dependent oxidoreductase (nitroreductase family)